MKPSFLRSTRFWPCLIVFFVFVNINTLFIFPAKADTPSVAEIEQYVRARIDMGEAMGGFFRNRERPQFGPDGGPSMEELRKLEAEINTFVAGILSKHKLTIDKWQSRSPDVFADEAGVSTFLDAHPDLKKRYEALPQNPRANQRGH